MKSRFLNVSPRAYLRQTDSVNNLPQIIRTGYQNEQGETSESFSDSDTQFFGTSREIIAPYMTSRSIAASSGFLTGTISFTGSISNRAAYLEKAVTGDPVYPFKESQVNPAIYNISTEGDGFPQNEYVGFSAAEYDKSALIFDISTSQDFDVLKINSGDTNLDPSGPFLGRGGSGFLYYNHKNRSWEDIGLRDPATGAAKSYDPIFTIDHDLISPENQYLIISGSDKFLCQFSSSPYSITSEGTNYVPKNTQALEARGYHRIGEPTSFFEAPYAPRYHATTGSSLKLSDYISHPFVVDRISVKVPISVLRTQTNNPAPSSPDFGFGRDIDNYVFFVYVQNRSNALKDSPQDVSSSIRYLIGKESLCVYNQNTLDYVSIGLGPIHSFGRSISFSMSNRLASSPGSPTAITQTRNANLSLTFRPRTFNNVFGTTSKLAGSEDDQAGGGSYVTGSVFVQNFWRGGQTASGSSGGITIPEIASLNFKNLNVRLGSFPAQADRAVPYATPSPRSFISSFWEGSRDTITTGSGLGEPGIETSTVSTYLPSTTTPVVLFPEDELVFGIDAGSNPNLSSPGRSGNGTDASVLDLTGSRLIIKQGDAQVILYGSLIQDKMQVLPTLNQHLGSDAIKEDIKEAGPYDQFDVYAKSIFSGSYVDNVNTGSLLISGRTRVARLSKGQGWITGSFQRNVKHLSDSNTLYYDTLVPTIPIISSSISNTNTYSVSGITDPSVLRVTNDSTFGYAFQKNRSGNSGLGMDPIFKNSTSTSSRIRELKVSLSTVSSIFSGDSARFLLYYNGNHPTVATSISKNYTGAASLSYGMMSPRLIGPTAVYRRDRYGQFRDLLEQTRDSKTVVSNQGKDSIGTSPVVARFVKQYSSTAEDPENTQCSNLSTECTSSMPFIDDNQVHNRGSLPSSYAVVFGPNNLIFGVTGSLGVS
jgi:hypothetical protein